MLNCFSWYPPSAFNWARLSEGRARGLGFFFTWRGVRGGRCQREEVSQGLSAAAVHARCARVVVSGRAVPSVRTVAALTPIVDLGL